MLPSLVTVGHQAYRGVYFVRVGSIRVNSIFFIFLLFLLMRTPLPRPRPRPIDLDRDRQTSTETDRPQTELTNWPRPRPIDHTIGTYPSQTTQNYWWLSSKSKLFADKSLMLTPINQYAVLYQIITQNWVPILRKYQDKNCQKTKMLCSTK